MGLANRVTGFLGAVFSSVWSGVTLGKDMRDNGEVYARAKAILRCARGELVREIAAVSGCSRGVPGASDARGLSVSADGN